MEVFSSIQGEGSYLGETQVFVRFARCPLRCLYCDTPGSWVVREKYRVISLRGAKLYENPANVARIVGHVEMLEKEAGRKLTVSLTGGEPLLYPEFLAALGARLRRGGRRVHLETAGVHPQGLRRTLASLDHVSMDWKLVSTLEAGDFARVQENFLHEARKISAQDLVVKIVLTPQVKEEEFSQAVSRIAAIDAGTPVILQPATPARKIRRRVPAVQLQRFTRIALSSLRSVRVLPQLHPLMKVK